MSVQKDKVALWVFRIAEFDHMTVSDSTQVQNFVFNEHVRAEHRQVGCHCVSMDIKVWVLALPDSFFELYWSQMLHVFAQLFFRVLDNDLWIVTASSD